MTGVRHGEEGIVTDISKFKPIGTMFCKEYKSKADFYIEPASDDAPRQLHVIYEKGGHNGQREFIAGIRGDWSERDVRDFIFWPMNEEAPYPIWEVPARSHGSDELFRWWSGEKPS
jgi:hypothetical protein